MTLISKHIGAYKGIGENKCCSVLLAVENVLAFIDDSIHSVRYIYLWSIWEINKIKHRPIIVFSALFLHFTSHFPPVSSELEWQEKKINNFSFKNPRLTFFVHNRLWCIKQAEWKIIKKWILFSMLHQFYSLKRSIVLISFGSWKIKIKKSIFLSFSIIVIS